MSDFTILLFAGILMGVMLGQIVASIVPRRFRLRTLFIVITVASVALGMISIYLRRQNF
jgi:hypothetical protein